MFGVIDRFPPANGSLVRRHRILGVGTVVLTGISEHALGTVPDLYVGTAACILEPPCVPRSRLPLPLALHSLSSHADELRELRIVSQ